MKNIGQPRRGEHLLPSLSLQDVLKSVAMTIVLLVMTVVLPILAKDLYVRDIYVPLVHNDPVISIKYSYYAVPALMFGFALIILIIVAGFIQRMFRVTQEQMKPLTDWFMKGLWLCLALLILLPLIGGRLTEWYVEDRGYTYCSALFEVGVGTITRGYVHDPRLCVPRRELEESLHRYGYADALVRYRFGEP